MEKKSAFDSTGPVQDAPSALHIAIALIYLATPILCAAALFVAAWVMLP